MKLSFFFLPFLLMTSCSCWPTSGIRVGEFSSLSGNESHFGKSTHMGIQLAFDEINAQGGIKGQKLVLVTRDTESTKEKTVEVVRALIEKDKVIALIGEVASERSMMAAQLAQIRKIPMISPASTSPGVTDVGSYIFRSCYLDSFQGLSMARFAFKDLKIRRVAVVRDARSSYSASLSEFFIEEFQKLGGKVVGNVVFNQNFSATSEVLQQLGTAKPEALFVPMYYSNTMDFIGILPATSKYLLLGGDGWDSQSLIESGHPKLEGAYFTNHFSPAVATPKAQDFISRFQAKFGSDPDGTAALGYDAAMLLVDAMKRASELKPPNIRDSLGQTKDFQGVTGRISFDKNRDAEKPLVILKIENKQTRLMKTME